MSFIHWVRNLRSQARPVGRIANPSHRPAARATNRFRPTLEALESRWMPSTLTVTNNLDSGSGSLRAEIAASHNGDTINFASSLDGQTITLSTGELLITKNLTIAGPADRSVKVSGSVTNPARVFEVAKTTKSVTLSGLTISNGSANGSTTSTIQGGGIYNHGTLTVSNSTLSYNTASNNGGGVSNDLGATVTISGCTVSNNTSPEGGGILNAGTMTVSGSTLSGNSGTDGGGIENGGTLTVSNSTLSGNSGGNRGGAIFNTGMATINAGTILSNNFARTGGGIGDQGTLTVSGSTLSNNSASGGGGIFVASSGTVTVSGSSLSGNSASFGGGIENLSGTLTVSGSTISGNSASDSGGGIYLFRGQGFTTTVTLTSDTMQSNTAINYGGGLYIVSGAAVYLDAFTVANILNNTDSSGLNGSTANIDGLYTLLH